MYCIPLLNTVYDLSQLSISAAAIFNPQCSGKVGPYVAAGVNARSASAHYNSCIPADLYFLFLLTDAIYISSLQRIEESFSNPCAGWSGTQWHDIRLVINS